MHNKDLRSKVQHFKAIDDVFFEKLMEDTEVCQEMLRVILEDEKLIVKHVVPQNSIRNLQGRSVRLDAFCVLGNGRNCNIEVQKSDNDDHVRRARYNASCITANITETGQHFKDVPDVCIVFISAFDFFKGNKTIYHVDKRLRETGQTIEDGLTEIFVNTEVFDNSNIAELMQCMKQEYVDNQKFPALSKRVNYYKNDVKGVDVMCSIMDELINEAVNETAVTKDKEFALRLLKRGESYDSIAELTGLSMEQIKEIEKSALQNA